MRVLLLFAVLFLIGLPVQAQDHLALITELNGSVVVARTNGDRTPATWGMQLFQGDVVETGAGAKAAILFSNNNLLSMGASSEMTISGGARPASGRSVDAGLTADVSDLTLHRTGVGEIAALGGLRSGGAESSIEPLSPHNTRARSSRPVFSWKGGPDFDRYVLKVMDSSGIIWTLETEDTSVEYPADAPVLDAETTYFWRVDGEEMIDVVSSALVQFQVLSDEGLTAIEEGEKKFETLFADDPGTSRDYMLGAFYAREGLADDAIAAFERIAGVHPGSPFLYEVLGKLYYETGRKDKAVAALQRAIQLRSDG